MTECSSKGLRRKSLVCVKQILPLLIFLVNASFARAEATNFDICGQRIQAAAGSVIVLGAWERKDGSNLCAGFVIKDDDDLGNAVVDYIAGKNFRTTLIGRFDKDTKTLILHDAPGSVFRFKITGKSKFAETFAGGSGSLIGSFENMTRVETTTIDQPADRTTDPPLVTGLTAKSRMSEDSKSVAGKTPDPTSVDKYIGAILSSDCKSEWLKSGMKNVHEYQICSNLPIFYRNVENYSFMYYTRNIGQDTDPMAYGFVNHAINMMVSWGMSKDAAKSFVAAAIEDGKLRAGCTYAADNTLTCPNDQLMKERAENARKQQLQNDAARKKNEAIAGSILAPTLPVGASGSDSEYQKAFRSCLKAESAFSTPLGERNWPALISKCRTVGVGPVGQPWQHLDR